MPVFQLFMNIKSTLYILSSLATKIKWISETSIISIAHRVPLSQISYCDEFFNKYPFSVSVSAICQDLQTIFCCSFIDEYDNKFNPKRYPNEAENIIRFKKIVSPAYKKIKIWKKGLVNHRNYLLAHNYRINGKSVFDMKEKVILNVPTTNAEYVLLSDLVFLIAMNFKIVFPQIMDEFDFNESLLDHIEFQSKKTNVNTLQELTIIEQEIKENIVRTDF